ncbi:TPA: hypothetical protein ACH3X3_000971 [Trebouxia sp. C0006]
MARDFMHKPDDEALMGCPQLEPFIHMLAEHHRMQPSPGPADYKLLRDGAVATLQILYLDVILLRHLVSTSEANKRPTHANEVCVVVGEIERITA